MLARSFVLAALIAGAGAALGPEAGIGAKVAHAQLLQSDGPAFQASEPQAADRNLAAPPPAPAGGVPASAERTAEQLEQLAADAQANRSSQGATARTPREMNFFQLLMDGGPLMIPLILISILVLTVSLERLINLRMSRILPRKLRKGLIEASEQRFPVDPQELYQMGLRYPSVASRVLENMLKKVGRPVPEMEAALQDSCQREAERLYSTVRWLTAAAAIAPLLGLLGTVWGMILAFFETTQPGIGINRTQHLAQGISIAFVNTLAGLSIAIPAAGFSHFFEGRIVKVMSLLQELMQTLIPRLERFEGVTRYDLETVGLVPRRRSEAQPPGAAAAQEPPESTDILSLDGEAAVRPRELPRTPAPSLPRSTRGR
ncbi:MAG: MotA/TolQ/ExbB proton channel family protein [Aureliella sp.]